MNPELELMGFSEEELAQAVAAAGVFGPQERTGRSRAEMPDYLAGLATSPQPVPFDPSHLFDLLQNRAAQYRDAWQKSVKQPSTIRLEISGTHLTLDRFRLASLLSRPSVAAGVHFIQNEPSVPVSWYWPIRIGLLNDERSRQLGRSIQRSRWSNLFRIIDVERLGRECDLLLIPYGLRSSLELILSRRGRVGADCVLVLGTPKVGVERAENLMATLRTEVETAGVGVVSVPAALRRKWFDSLIVELSHNYPLDVALLRTASELKTVAPVLIASRKLMQVARLSEYVERLADQLSAAAEGSATIELQPSTSNQLLMDKKVSIKAAAKVLKKNAKKYGYVHETGDAGSVVDFTKEVEKTFERPLILAKANGGGGAPPPPSDARDPRRVQADFLDPDSDTRAEKILPEREYVVEILIDKLDEKSGLLAPTRGIPLLPPSSEGHELRILFTELRDGDRKPLTPSRQADIHLPPTGPSDRTRFAIRTAGQGRFIARVVILHRTRVLQTLILTAPLNAPRSEARFEEETIVRREFAGLESRRTFDAAIVHNHNGDVPGVGVATRENHSFNEPEGLRKSVEKIEEQLSLIADLEDKDVKLTSKPVMDIVRKLALHGNAIWDAIAQGAPAELATATRLQVVETRYGAYLPIEFFYDQFAPEDDAKLCPHGLKVLAGKSNAKCPNAQNSKFVCLPAFWGFSRIIERRPHNQQNDKDFEISEPTLDRPRVELFGNTLVGWSDNVTKSDMTGAKGLLKSLKKLIGKDPDSAKDWASWKTLVAKKSPALLILLPHSLEDPEESGFAALEIGKKNLRAANLEAPYVRHGSREPGPVVLLLGCSTELTSIPFHNFVARFRSRGAALVLGTLATIRGKHAALFVPKLMASLQKFVGEPDATFGDALLEVKRQMLSAGNPFVLTLVAYGDADWRL